MVKQETKDSAFVVFLLAMLAVVLFGPLFLFLGPLLSGKNDWKTGAALSVLYESLWLYRGYRYSRKSHPVKAPVAKE